MMMMMVTADDHKHNSQSRQCTFARIVFEHVWHSLVWKYSCIFWACALAMLWRNLEHLNIKNKDFQTQIEVSELNAVYCFFLVISGCSIFIYKWSSLLHESSAVDFSVHWNRMSFLTLKPHEQRHGRTLSEINQLTVWDGLIRPVWSVVRSVFRQGFSFGWVSVCCFKIIQTMTKLEKGSLVRGESV